MTEMWIWEVLKCAYEMSIWAYAEVLKSEFAFMTSSEMWIWTSILSSNLHLKTLTWMWIWGYDKDVKIHTK